MIVIGHRGASGIEPENTIRSFKKAEELGVSMVELDVRESADGEIVVFHDHTLERQFGINKSVAGMSVAELKDASMPREIPTLDEVLASITCDVNIEIKVHGIEEKVLSKIKNFPHKVLISSFYPGILKKIRALDGKIPLGLNFARVELRAEHLFSFITRKVKLSSIHIQNKYVSWATVNLARLLASQVYVWTVDTKQDFEQMKKLGVDGVFTDHPELIKET